jgi:hypothetical protein
MCRIVSQLPGCERMCCFMEGDCDEDRYNPGRGGIDDIWKVQEAILIIVSVITSQFLSSHGSFGCRVLMVSEFTSEMLQYASRRIAFIQTTCW